MDGEVKQNACSDGDSIRDRSAEWQGDEDLSELLVGMCVKANASPTSEEGEEIYRAGAT